ncbi:MAG TPA: hypothetical protein VFI57_02610 [Pyrinomonadaceae bacterium]|nr:hypothetical protein [Pyrinomonadaceae bacterium]
MNNPTQDMPQLPSNLRDKLDQISQMVKDLQRDLLGTQIDPVDDTQLPPWKKPINQDNTADIVAALGKLTDPFIRRSGTKIEGIEMTQSTQFYNLHGQGSGDDSDNMVPLVAGKDLILRVYVERRHDSLFAAPDQFDGIVSYRNKQVGPLNGPQRLQEATALRRNLINDSLNFRIPASDCHGTVTFKVRVFEWRSGSKFINPAVFDTYHTANYTIVADFREIPRMRVTGVLIHFTGNNMNWAAPTGIDLVNTLARFLPMFPTPGFDYNFCQVQDVGLDLTVRKNWDQLLTSITTIRSMSTMRTFFVGLLPSGVATLAGAAARGIGNNGVAVASHDDTRALSHELGHACSLPHVNFNGPEPPFDDKYPKYSGFAFGSIGEEGIDTARLALYHPKTSFDFMTYNENGPTVLFTQTTWISPHNYKKMMYALRATDGTGDFPLIAGIVVTVIAINFRAHRDGRIEIRPSYPLTDMPYTRDIRETTNVRVELYDRRGEVIESQRCHVHNPYQDPEGPYLDFHEVIRWSDEVAEVAFLRDGRELHRARVGEAVPQVHVEAVRRAEREDQGDLARVDWTVSRENLPEDRFQVGAAVRYTNDGGRTWHGIAADLTEGRCLVNLDLLPGGEECRFQVIVSSGLSATVTDTETFAVQRKPRRAQIISPQDGQTFQAGEPIVFFGAGHSPDLGTSADDEVTWTSNVECCGIGTGSRIVRDDLPAGRHCITMRTPDGQGSEASASVWIKVLENPTDKVA